MKKYILFPLICGFLLTGCGMIHESSDTAASPAEEVTSAETVTETSPAEIVPSDWDIPDDILQPDREPFEVEMNGETVTVIPETPAYYMVTSSDSLKRVYVGYFDKKGSSIKTNIYTGGPETTVYKYDENGKPVSSLVFKFDDGKYNFKEEYSISYRPDGTLESSELKKADGTSSISYFDEHENFLYETNRPNYINEYEYAPDGRSYKKYNYKKGGDEPIFLNEYTLNDNGDPLTETHVISDFYKTVTEYTYDDDGKCLKEVGKTINKDSESIDYVSVYTYDQQGRNLKEEITEYSDDEEKISIVDYYYYDNGERK